MRTRARNATPRTGELDGDDRGGDGLGGGPREGGGAAEREGGDVAVEAWSLLFQQGVGWWIAKRPRLTKTTEYKTNPIPTQNQDKPKKKKNKTT